MHSFAQNEGLIRNAGTRLKQTAGGLSRGLSGGGSTDSLRHRNKLEDSITISYRFLDSAGSYKLDSAVSDFTRYFPVPGTNIHLGNLGTASRSLLFSPVLRSGFDPGFHAYDIYKWDISRVRFYNTTRPYSQLVYQLGSRSEQTIQVLHTQNIKPNWNFLFQYRLIGAPGFYKNQKSAHNNYLFTSFYQSNRKRYSAYVVLLGNKMQCAESGGLQDNANYLDDPVYKDRFNIPTKIGGKDVFTGNFFNSKINTGNKYNEFTFLLRQQYDLGKKDSVVSDSTVIYLFFPRVRFEHTFSYSKLKYEFLDQANTSNGGYPYVPDSIYYQDNYHYTLLNDTLIFRDRWKDITNDFSIYQFPDAKNQQQFIKLGLMVQNLSGEFPSGNKNYFNTAGHAEYRNKTRNQQWDIEAAGRLYFTGFNAGDYEAHISLQKLLGKKTGYLQLGFENASRTPSFIFNSRSSFNLSAAASFKKENNTHLFATYLLPSFKLKLSGHYYLLTNYTYLTKYYQFNQESTLFNLLQVAAQKTIRLHKRWVWHTELYFQKRIGSGPVNVPFFCTRNRIAYEGSFGFKNLDIATGLEIRYISAYKADMYSPVHGMYFYQDSVKISNKVPDIAAYVHFRIRPFKAFVRVENLNAMEKKKGQGLGFTNNSVVVPGYAMPGLQIRLGIYWNFVN